MSISKLDQTEFFFVSRLKEIFKCDEFELFRRMHAGLDSLNSLFVSLKLCLPIQYKRSDRQNVEKGWRRFLYCNQEIVDSKAYEKLAHMLTVFDHVGKVAGEDLAVVFGHWCETARGFIQNGGPTTHMTRQEAAFHFFQYIRSGQYTFGYRVFAGCRDEVLKSLPKLMPGRVNMAQLFVLSFLWLDFLVRPTSLLMFIEYGSESVPVRKCKGSVGFDIPIDELIVLGAGEEGKVKLAYGVDIPEGYFATLHPRSSLHLAIGQGVGVIDSKFKRQLQFVVKNTGSATVVLGKGSYGFQIVMHKEEVFDWGIRSPGVSDEESSAGFGSSNLTQMKLSISGGFGSNGCLPGISELFQSTDPLEVFVDNVVTIFKEHNHRPYMWKLFEQLNAYKREFNLDSSQCQQCFLIAVIVRMFGTHFKPQKVLEEVIASNSQAQFMLSDLEQGALLGTLGWVGEKNGPALITAREDGQIVGAIWDCGDFVGEKAASFLKKEGILVGQHGDIDETQHKHMLDCVPDVFLKKMVVYKRPENEAVAKVPRKPRMAKTEASARLIADAINMETEN